MATKTITITENAYERLASLKKGNESFSEVIEKVTGKVRLSDFHGVISKEFADELEENIKTRREVHKKLHSQRTKRIIGELN